MTDDRTQIVSTDSADATRVVTPEEAQPRLVRISDPGAGHIFAVPRGKSDIGRSPDAWLAIDDPAVSGHHITLEQHGNSVSFRDLNSHNGTWVNGLRQKQGQLDHGDTVQIGRTAFQFACTNDPLPPARPVPTTLPVGNRRRPVLIGLLVTGVIALVVFDRHMNGVIPGSPPTAANSQSSPIDGPGQGPPAGIDQAPPREQDLPAPKIEPVKAETPGPGSDPRTPAPKPGPSPAPRPTQPEPVQLRPAEPNAKPTPANSPSPVPDGTTLAGLAPVLKKLITQQELDAAIREVGRCTDCPGNLKGLLDGLRQPPTDLPGVLEAARRYDQLAGMDLIDDALVIRKKDELAATVDGLLRTVISQGAPERAASILAIVAKSGIDLGPGHVSVQELQDRAESDFQSAYALERINPAESRRQYQQALKVAPPGSRVRQRITDRLDQIP